MTTFEEAEVGLGKDSVQVILKGIMEAVVVDQDQVWEPILIEVELDVLHVGNMIISLETV